MNPLLAETRTISLEPGARLLVVGANKAGIEKFLTAGEDRYHFMDADTAQTAKELPGKNFQSVVINKRIPPKAQENIQTIADRFNVQDVFLVTGSGAIQRMMEGYPFKTKGVATFDIPEVLERIELRAPRQQRLPTPAATPPEKPTSAPEPPPQPPVTLKGLLDRLEQIYQECSGDHKRVIACFRGHGYTEEVISYGALYQRCKAIKERNGQPPHRGRPRKTKFPMELLSSEAATELLVAIETMSASQELLVKLAAQLISENQQLKAAATEQGKELQEIPELRKEVLSLREKAHRARELFT